MELVEKINKVLEELGSDIRVEGREVGKCISVNVIGKGVLNGFLVTEEAYVFVHNGKCVISYGRAESLEFADRVNGQLIQVGLDKSDSNYERLNWKVFEDF